MPQCRIHTSISNDLSTPKHCDEVFVSSNSFMCDDCINYCVTAPCMLSTICYVISFYYYVITIKVVSEFHWSFWCSRSCWLHVPVRIRMCVWSVHSQSGCCWCCWSTWKSIELSPLTRSIRSTAHAIPWVIELT